MTNATIHYITADETTAYVYVNDLQVVFQNSGARLSPTCFTAVAAFDRTAHGEIALDALKSSTMVECANVLRAKLAEMARSAKPRKLTFAQVQRIFGRA